MSPKSAGLAKKWGYTNVSVYVQGEPAWKKAGFLTTSTPQYLKIGNVVIVDLRSSDDVSRGHIPGAVHIPLSQIESAKSMFPSFKGAHIVFYSDSIESMRSAVSKVSEWGYKKATALIGGINDWQSAGYKLSSGAASKEIHYVRKLSPGEISISDFRNAMSTDTIILDVRTPEEFKSGHFPKALNIPVDDLPSRFVEIPKNGSVLTQCKTGVRAEMAFNILKKKGYDVKFLNAKPEFNSDGGYSLQEW